MTTDTTANPFERYDEIREAGPQGDREKWGEQLRAAHKACRPSEITALFQFCSDPQAATDADDCDPYRDVYEIHWLKEALVKWPMIFWEIYCSPEIMNPEDGPVDIASVLLEKGASCSAPHRDRPLPPLKPFVLDWLEGRTWEIRAYGRNDWTYALQAMGELGAEALPQSQDELNRLLFAMHHATAVFEQLPDHPARALGADALRGLIDLRARGLLEDGYGEDLNEIIEHRAFGDDARSMRGDVRSPPSSEYVAAYREAAVAVLSARSPEIAPLADAVGGPRPT